MWQSGRDTVPKESNSAKDFTSNFGSSPSRGVGAGVGERSGRVLCQMLAIHGQILRAILAAPHREWMRQSGGNAVPKENNSGTDLSSNFARSSLRGAEADILRAILTS